MRYVRVDTRTLRELPGDLSVWVPMAVLATGRPGSSGKDSLYVYCSLYSSFEEPDYVRVLSSFRDSFPGFMEEQPLPAILLPPERCSREEFSRSLERLATYAGSLRQLGLKVPSPARLALSHLLSPVRWVIGDTRGVEEGAAAVVSASAPAPYTVRKLPTIFATQFGNTTPHLLVAKDYLSKQGYDLVAFHALGRTGGYTMERLIEAGVAVGVLDVTTHELVDEVAGGVLSASVGEKKRLTAAAGAAGIPQVVLPGAVDMINFWAPETVPERFRERCAYEHSRGLVTLIRATAEELYRVGKVMAERLNKAIGPTAVIFPLRGFSIIDNDPNARPKNAPPGAYCQKMVFSDGRVVFEKTDRPWYDPRADLHLLKALVEDLELSRPNIDLIVLDYNINDPEVALLSAKILDSMVKGTWKKGEIPEVPGLDLGRMVRDPVTLVREKLG